jgi:S1-C subfamily serine protease
MRKLFLLTALCLSIVYSYPKLLNYLNTKKVRVENRIGSAALITFNGKHYGLTAAHLCGKSPSLQVQGFEGQFSILKVDPSNDICVFEAPATNYPHLKLSNASPVEYQTLLQAGYPEGKHFSVKRGRLLTLPTMRFLESEPFFYSDTILCSGKARFFPKNKSCVHPLHAYSVRIDTTFGNSGGPVLNVKNEVVGIVSAFKPATETTSSIMFFVDNVNIKKNIWELNDK